MESMKDTNSSHDGRIPVPESWVSKRSRRHMQLISSAIHKQELDLRTGQSPQAHLGRLTARLTRSDALDLAISFGSNYSLNSRDVTTNGRSQIQSCRKNNHLFVLARVFAAQVMDWTMLKPLVTGHTHRSSHQRCNANGSQRLVPLILFPQTCLCRKLLADAKLTSAKLMRYRQMYPWTTVPVWSRPQEGRSLPLLLEDWPLSCRSKLRSFS